MSLAAKLLIFVTLMGLAWALGFRLGLAHKQGQWDAAKLEAMSQARNAERKGIEFNRAAAAARRASAATANLAAKERAERVYRATETASAPAGCTVSDGVRDDLAAAIAAANAAR